MSRKRVPGHFDCNVCPPQQGKGGDGLENMTRRWAAAYLQPGTGPPQVKSQKGLLPEPLSASSQAAETNPDSTASHESLAKATLPASHTLIPPPRLCFLITLPLTSKGKKKEKLNGFPTSWPIFFLPPCFYQLAGTLDSLFSTHLSNPSSLPLQHLSQHASALNGIKSHDSNSRLNMNET